MPAYYRSIRSGTQIRGLDETFKDLNQRLERVKHKTLRGLIRVQAKIFSDMDTQRPRIPMDVGNLRESYYAVTSKGAIIRGKSPDFEEGPHVSAGQLYTDHIEAVTDAVVEAAEMGIRRGPTIVFGFSAFYAPYMENKLQAKKGERHWIREGSGPHFFRSALRRNRTAVVRILQEEVNKRK